MDKRSGSRAGALTALAGIGVVMLGCSSVGEKGSAGDRAAERPGNVALALSPVSGATINVVHFVVTRGTSVVAEGNLPTPGSSAQMNFGLGLPVGTGYRLSLSATAVETSAINCTGSYGPFDVLPNSSTGMSLTLSCVDNGTGQTLPSLGIATDGCPRLIVDHVVAAPSHGAPGSPLDVAAVAHDLDGLPVTYSWSAPLGMGLFAAPQLSSTSFACEGLGEVELTITASNGECDSTRSTTVTCLPADSCGNGVLEPELETCDTALDPSCPADCTRVCGDGVAEVGEACDLGPANPAVCDPTTCQLVPQVCGDGVITPPEVCEPQAGSFCCSPDCLSMLVPACGDGNVFNCGGGGDEECDDAGGSALCSAECERVGTQACLDCEEAGDCFEFFDNCSAFTGVDRTLCNDVIQCVQDSDCYDGTNALGFCFCGSVPASMCGAAPLTGPGSPDGACKNLIQAGLMPLTTSAQALGLLTAVARPSGAGLARLQCQKVANASACRGVCGFDTTGFL